MSVKCVVAIVGGFNETFNTAAVKPSALEFICQNTSPLRLGHQGIGDLDLAAFAGLSVADQVEDIRGENIAADNGQVGLLLPVPVPTVDQSTNVGSEPVHNCSSCRARRALTGWPAARRPVPAVPLNRWWTSHFGLPSPAPWLLSPVSQESRAYCSRRYRLRPK